MTEGAIRVLLAKAGLDGHDRGLGVIARALRDSGMEVVYLGIHQTPETVARAALEEDVDVVALSVLSGAHMTVFSDVLKRLRDFGLDVLLTGGGIIPDEDKRKLEAMGIGKIFDPGTPTHLIVDYIRQWYDQRNAAREAPPKRNPSKK